MVCKTWCCFIWTECSCKNVYFSMDTLVRPNGGQALLSHHDYSAIILAVFCTSSSPPFKSEHHRLEDVVFFFFYNFVLLSLFAFYYCLRYLFSTELLYVDWRHTWSQNAPQKWSSTLDHNLFSVLLDCIYTCTFTWV